MSSATAAAAAGLSSSEEEQLLKSLGLSAHPDTVLVVQGSKQVPKFVCQYHGKAIDARVGIPVFKGKQTTEVKKYYGSFGTWDAALAFINYCTETGRCDPLQAMQLSSNVHIVSDQGVIPIAALEKKPKIQKTRESDPSQGTATPRPGKLVVGHPESGQRYRDFEQLTKDLLVSPLGLKQYHLAVLPAPPGQEQPLMAIRQTKILKDDLKELKNVWALAEAPVACSASSASSEYLSVALNCPLKKKQKSSKNKRAAAVVDAAEEDTVVESKPAKKQKKAPVDEVESKPPSKRKPSAHKKELHKQKEEKKSSKQKDKKTQKKSNASEEYHH